MIWLILLALVVWAVVMSLLFTPNLKYSSLFDRLTKAKWRQDRVNLQIMLDHLRSFPDQWSISRDSASFPHDGAKQIYLNYNEKRSHWTYSLASFGGGSRLLNGHFEQQFVRLLETENNQRESAALLRNFYPDLNGPLLLK